MRGARALALHSFALQAEGSSEGVCLGNVLCVTVVRSECGCESETSRHLTPFPPFAHTHTHTHSTSGSRSPTPTRTACSCAPSRRC